jgi:8-amino-3,8-dideoxy-alpha-D-manno-octulosonate transaminase
VVSELKAQNTLAGNFYWYDNNWHYVRKWDHLKNNLALNSLSDAQQSALKQLSSQKFSASDAIMSRCISSAISLLWTEAQIREKGDRINSAIRKVLSDQAVPIH